MWAPNKVLQAWCEFSHRKINSIPFFLQQGTVILTLYWQMFPLNGQIFEQSLHVCWYTSPPSPKTKALFVALKYQNVFPAEHSGKFRYQCVLLLSCADVPQISETEFLDVCARERESDCMLDQPTLTITRGWITTDISLDRETTQMDNTVVIRANLLPQNC